MTKIEEDKSEFVLYELLELVETSLNLYQMYPLRLVPLVVRRVPSAHVLINAIGELITGACLERRIFAILLAIELLKQVHST